MTRMFSTPEEMARYEELKAAEEAERAERAAAAQAEREMTAQSIFAGILAMPRDHAQKLWAMPIESRDSMRGISSSTVHSEYDMGLSYNGPRGIESPTTFLVADRTLNSQSRDSEAELSVGVDRLTVFAPDSSDDWRLPVFYGLRGTRVATFKFDREAGVVSAELPGVGRDVLVSDSPLAFEAVSDLVADLEAAPQRVVTDVSEPPRARAI
jgi:hypothetical protein